MEIDTYLQKLDELIDTQHIRESERLQVASWNYEEIDRLPIILSSMDDMSKERSPITDWPVFNYNEIYADMDKMLLDELTSIYEGSLLKDDKMYTIRANHGVGIIPSLFGCELIDVNYFFPPTTIIFPVFKRNNIFIYPSFRFLF